MMSFARHSEMLSSVKANARKVYDAVPINEGWTYSELHQEVQRSGMNMTSEVLMGCVCRLKDAGLVFEPEQYRFQRTPHKQRPILRAVTQSKDDETMTKPAGKPEPAPSTFDQLSGLAVRMRKLGEDAASLASDLDDIALAMEDKLHVDDAELSKLRTLRDLMKSL
jgi:hypothetical protein